MYGIDVDQLREYIVRPVLTRLSLHSKVAENLVIGTALHESHLVYLHQIKGPALGVYQMEPATHYDIHENYLKYRRDLKMQVIRFSGHFSGDIPDPGELMGNLFYATAMCCVHYLRVKEQLPANSAGELAGYWKRHYNTKLGKGTVEQALPHFTRAIA
jgi:hypothetical protein